MCHESRSIKMVLPVRPHNILGFLNYGPLYWGMIFILAHGMAETIPD